MWRSVCIMLTADCLSEKLECPRKLEQHGYLQARRIHNMADQINAQSLYHCPVCENERSRCNVCCEMLRRAGTEIFACAESPPGYTDRFLNARICIRAMTELYSIRIMTLDSLIAALTATPHRLWDRALIVVLEYLVRLGQDASSCSKPESIPGIFKNTAWKTRIWSDAQLIHINSSSGQRYLTPVISPS